MSLSQRSWWSRSVSIVLIAVIALTAPGVYAEDLFIRDDTADTGVEPNPNTGGMWMSPDIWVRRDPMPGWNPAPYPIGAPPSWLDTTHFDPDYRSPISGRPNYVYVRVRNRGTASTGTNERLLVYWAAASTGLSWDPLKAGGPFIDNVVAGTLHGSEITKPRESAATATPTERSAYINAIIDIADQLDPNVNFPGGTTYWHTQQEIHRFGPPWRHGSGTTFVPSVAFLPWHREYINRYEGLLQEANPTVKLLYWEWTQQPETGPFNYFTSSFMGSSGFGLTAGTTIGAPLSPATDGIYPNPFTGLNAILRRRQTTGTIEADLTITNRANYDSNIANTNFSGRLEAVSHNSSHGRIGGYWGPTTPFNAGMAGDQLLQPYAARDPFFFMLHAKVDQLWATWQRKTTANHDPATTYGTAQGDANILATLGPWDGVAFSDNLPNDNTTGQVEPWSTSGGHINVKTGLDRSVVSPPIYDKALLTIPAMGTNQEAILEIPWYPPDPAKFGSAPLHACLVARIETAVPSPFGMTTAETTNLGANTKANNNIAWRNVSVVDIIPGPLFRIQFFARNIFTTAVTGGLRLAAHLDRPGDEFFRVGRIRADLGPQLGERWRNGGARGYGIETTEDPNVVLVTAANATLENIAFQAGETFPVNVLFELNRDYTPTRRGEHLNFDVVQTGAPGAPAEVVGGNRYQVAVEKLTLVQAGREWRFFGTKPPAAGWTGVTFDDSAWHRRRIELGLIDPAGPGMHGSGPKTTTTYLRHRFQVDDPSFIRNTVLRLKQSDGAIAYLNGTEIYRANLPTQDVTYQTPAEKPVQGVAREAFTLLPIDPKLLRQGTNVLAVEVHRATDNVADLTFDAELNANWLEPREKPAAVFTNVDGELRNADKPTTVEVDAFDGDGRVRRVTLLVDGKEAGAADAAPYRFEVPVRFGPQRLTAFVDDDRGERTLVHSTITGVANIPPKVAFIQPGIHSDIAAGDTLVVVADAFDPDGEISRVDFYLNDTIVFSDPAQLIASVMAPPYSIAIPNLKARHNMIRAVAYDNAGARTGAIPIMVMVHGGEGAHTGH